MNRAEEAVSGLIISSDNDAVDFQTAEHALNKAAVLVLHPIVFDLHAAG